MPILEKIKLIFFWFMRGPFWLLFGLFLGFVVPYFWHLDRLVRDRFADLKFAVPSRVYARPLSFSSGQSLTKSSLVAELVASRYRELELASEPGSYQVSGSNFIIVTRPFTDLNGLQPSQAIRVELANGKIKKLQNAYSGSKLDGVKLDPARIATLYGTKQQERRYIRLEEVPPIVVKTLIAVEDRKFYQHVGIDPLGIVRALGKNVVAGEMVQGGSTLTQQLVRSLFLNRAVKLSRKINEASLAILIEARFSKERILEAYINEVYLGQQGAQEIHGLAAASEFYFGRELSGLQVHEVAQLVGMIQGPSLFDPRRSTVPVKARRDLVLAVLAEQKIINRADQKLATSKAILVASKGGLPKNRYPAFMEYVRAQIQRDFPDAALQSEGMTIHTTISPAAQFAAEAAVADQIKSLGRNGADLQAALILSNAQTGAIEAMVGGRDANEQGFNRALRAQRPIGSLIKPFVYLVALAQPDLYSVSSVLNDRAITLKQRGGKIWKPANSDNREHGDVNLVDALAQSYNLATVRLGLDVGLEKIAKVMEALVPGSKVQRLPSITLGAVDMSPIQIAQAYQYLASDGKLMPLVAVRGVLDRNGRALSRYSTGKGPQDLVQASRLVTYALQQTAKRGTAAALVNLGLGDLHVAGKTGTSNDLRDSWFAGYTGSHLAVVWMGRDDYKQTKLYGATGAMRVWARLIKDIPTTALRPDFTDDPQMVWINPYNNTLTDPQCEGAVQRPFVRGYEPNEYAGCAVEYMEDWFGIGDEPSSDSAENLNSEVEQD